MNIETGCGAQSRAAILDGLQKVGLRHRPLRQMAACQIVLATHGRELTLLKSLLDDGPDYHTTYKLIYYDLQVSRPLHCFAMHKYIFASKAPECLPSA